MYFDQYMNINYILKYTTKFNHMYIFNLLVYIIIEVKSIVINKTYIYQFWF